MDVSERYKAVADRTRGAFEKYLDIWRDGMRSVSDHAGWPSGLAHVDVSDAVDQYFDAVQQLNDFGRQYAHKLVSAVGGASPAR